MNSPFPPADEAGRLLCKNCGIPFDWATVKDVREYFEVRVMRNQHFVVRCRECDTASMFFEGDTRAAPATVTA